MQSVQLHQIIEAGTTYGRSFIYTTTAGDLVDLTDWSGEMKVKKAASDVAAVLTPVVTVDTVTSTISFELTPAETSSLNEQDVYVYAIELHNVDGTVIRFIEGNFTISAEVVD